MTFCELFKAVLRRTLQRIHVSESTDTIRLFASENRPAHGWVNRDGEDAVASGTNQQGAPDHKLQ